MSGGLLATFVKSTMEKPDFDITVEYFLAFKFEIELDGPMGRRVGRAHPIPSFREVNLGLSLHSFCKPIRSALVSQRLFKPQQFVLRPFIDEGSLHLALQNRGCKD